MFKLKQQTQTQVTDKFFRPNAEVFEDFFDTAVTCRFDNTWIIVNLSVKIYAIIVFSYGNVTKSEAKKKSLGKKFKFELMTIQCSGERKKYPRVVVVVVLTTGLHDMLMKVQSKSVKT